LQAARKRNDALFGFVGSQEFVALLFVSVSKLFLLFLLFFAEVGLQRRHNRLRVLVTQERSAAGQSVFESAHQYGRVNVYTISLHGLSDIHADGITDLIFVGVEGQRGGRLFCGSLP
jgi:hypothetical protein